MCKSQDQQKSQVAVASGSAPATSEQDVQSSRAFNRFNFINILAWVFNFLITYGFGNLGWADRPNNGELSDKNQTIATPAGRAFTIWAVIFMWQLFWALWQLLPSQRNNPAVYAVSYYYLLVTLVQAGWTLSFTWEINWLAFIFMILILTFLMITVYRLQKVEKRWKGYLLWQFPISLHGGWIMAASAVNFNLLFVAYGGSTTAQLVAACLSLIVLLCGAIFFLSQYPVDLTPPFVLVWALGWVYSELQSPKPKIVERFTTSQIEGFQIGVLAGAAIILAFTLVKIVYVCAVQSKQEPPQMKEESSDVESSNK